MMAYAKGRDSDNRATAEARLVPTEVTIHGDSTAPSSIAKNGRDKRLEGVVGPVLRIGSLISMALILTGLALTVLGWPVTRLIASPAPTLGSVFQGPGGTFPTTLINLGILVLIATPVARVASTVVFFLARGELSYLAITAYVLMVLLAGFLLGATG
ncbi:MAG TPA: DUF1634 domain-containing protein [Chloroflexota bacterium]|nr:DUF1634 domain-containing protein [Chloroflexota bacterium]